MMQRYNNNNRSNNNINYYTFLDDDSVHFFSASKELVDKPVQNSLNK